METGLRIKLPSNDSSFEEDTLSDVDDEVFIKSARNGFRNGGRDKTLQKPLMAPRKKADKDKAGAQNGHRSNGAHHLMEIHTASPQGSPVLITVLYVAIAIGAITGLTGLVIFLAKSHLPDLVSQVGMWRPSKDKQSSLPEPCNSFLEETVWEVNLPHAISQGQRVTTTVKINNENVDDVIIGFDSGLNGVTPLTSFLCQLYFNMSSSTTVCDGGLIGINGSTGAILWTTWLDDAVISIKCLADLDEDGVKDCIAIGRSRGLWAISPADGHLIWGTATDSLQLSCLTGSTFRSAQIVEDITGDKIPDVVVAIKSGRVKCPDYIVLLNGFGGNVLQLTGTADQRPIAIGPLLKASGDGSTFVLYTTNNINLTSSSLYSASLKDIATGRRDLVRTVLGNVSRIEEMVTADITGDGMEDLILVFDNSTGGGKDVSAFSGTGGFESLWTSTFSSIGSIKVQALANLNEDNVPDVVLQITGKLMPNATSNSTWIRVVDGKNGHVIMNLPPRSKRWDVRGESLAVDGPRLGADIIVDWIADDDEANNRTVNRLMGFSSRGELPAFVVYNSPGGSQSSRPSGFSGAETSLHDVLDTVASRDDLRAKFSNYIRHAESERSSAEESARMTSEMEPGMVGYPAQHGIRKHGNRWNAQPRREKYPPTYDYEDDQRLPADLLPPDGQEAIPRRRKPVPIWGGSKDSAAGVAVDNNNNEEEDTVYLNPNDYVDGGGAARARSDYDDMAKEEEAAVVVDSRDYSSRYRQQQQQRPSKQSSWGAAGRRGKRIRRQASGATSPDLQQQPAESIRFPPLTVGSGILDGSVDLVMGVQYSWSEPEEKEDQLRGLADCVSRRLDQGRVVSDDAVVDYAAECSQSLLLRGKAASSSELSMTNSRADQLVSSTVDHWLRPLARRLHGWVSLKRIRLRCRCRSSSGGIISTTTTTETPSLRPRTCSSLRPQRLKVDFHY